MAEQQTTLGKTDIKIPLLGTGAWAWGDRLSWGFGNGYGEADVKNAFDISLNAGINFFDTAEIYGSGQSELYLGRFVHQTKQPIVIATKFLPFPWRWRRTSLDQALRRSLKRLGVERVDLYQIHQPLPPVPIETWVDELGQVVQAGLTRSAGVSNYNADQTRRAAQVLARRNIPLASNQVKYSLLDRHIERDGLMQTCKELGVTIIAYSPIEMGLLSGKYTPDHRPSGMRSIRYNRKYLERIQPVIARLREIGQAHGGKTPAQVALNWVICKGAVPIPGAKNERQAQENVGALGWQLTENEVAALEQASDEAQ